MRKLSHSYVLVGTIVAITLGSAAHAGETTVAGLYPAIPNNSNVMAKEDGSSVVVFDLKGMLTVGDASNPWHGALMDCNGIGAYAADGAIQTEGGMCMITDADGDVQRLPWERVNADGGTWRIAGGTGKFAKMTGSGTWNNVPLADGRLLNSWTFTQVTP